MHAALFYRALTRTGNAYVKKGDFENGLTFYKESLAMYKDGEIVKKIKTVSNVNLHVHCVIVLLIYL